MKSIETQLHEALGQVEKLTFENTSLKTAIHSVQVECARRVRQYILKDAQLSGASVARLNAAFINSTDNSGLKQAINVERKSSPR